MVKKKKKKAESARIYIKFGQFLHTLRPEKEHTLMNTRKSK